MSSRSTRHLRVVLLAGLAANACADFRRGDSWDDPADDTGAATSGDDDGAPGDDGPATTAADDDGPATTAADDDDGATTGTPSGPTFADDVHPLLLAGCERCHATDGQANATAFILVDDVDADYAVTLEFVNTDTPSNSRLLGKAAGQGHIGGVIYDDHSPEYTTIRTWIESGATP